MAQVPQHPPTHAAPVPVRDDWLAQLREDVLDPALPIVDPHHHLWERPGWRYLLDELRADLDSGGAGEQGGGESVNAAGHNVRATVFVQCRAMYRAEGPEDMRPVGETEFVNGVAAMSASGGYGEARVCAGIVGHADLMLGALVQPVLEAHLRAAGDRFRGIRHITTWDADRSILNPGYSPPADALARPEFREGFARLAPLGLCFDAWLYQTQLDQLAALARAFPETTIVLDHMGGPLRIGPYAGKDEDTYARWRAAMRDVAACSNVMVKLGGLGMRSAGFGFHEKPRPPSSAELADAWRPFVEPCIEMFGVERCMFESNFPVDKIAYGYAIGWNAFKRIADGCTAAEKHSLFSDTATRVYRLAVPA